MKRIDSIDIMRGLTLFLMLFVNDLYMPGVPEWLGHMAADYDGLGLADWVFPGFLFMVGLSIPFAIQARKEKGHSSKRIFGHILIRSVSLLIIGVMMVNIGRYNADLTGMNKFVWAILIYVSFFLIWNKYPDNSLLFKALKIGGLALLIVLALIFRAGSLEDPSWLRTSWWGILGLIGWGYLGIASIYLLIGDRIIASSLVLFFFLGLNILSQTDLMNFPDLVQQIFGVILGGNVPLIVSSGLLTGILLKKREDHLSGLLAIYVLGGVLFIILGFVLRNWFIISKIQGTPSWAMICNGISLILFALVLYLVDIKKIKKWAFPFFPAGRNSLTTYLAPDILYYSIWATSLPILFYKQDQSQLLAVGGSIAWALAMIGLAVFLSRIKIRLKL